MKHSAMVYSLILFLVTGTSFRSKNEVNPIPEGIAIQNNNIRDMGNKLKLKIGAKTFTATLLDNATTTALKKLLPLTVEMVELNRNEKYVRLPQNLPMNASNPGTIQVGDLMLYGSNTLVLFYETFPTSYTYTKIGRLDDASGLVIALGAGNATITFELE